MAKINEPRASGQAGDSAGFDGNPGQQVSGRPSEHERAAAGDQTNLPRNLEEKAGRFVAANPFPSVLTGFGLGLGFGLVVTLLLTRREETWYERNVPDSIQQWPKQLKKVPETVASQVSQAWNRW